MSFRTNPQNLRNRNTYFFEIPHNQINYLRQNFIIYTYVKSFLDLKFIKIIHFSCKINTRFWFIWMTYYNYIKSITKGSVKIYFNNQKPVLQYKKSIRLQNQMYFQKKINTLTFLTKVGLYFFKKKTSTLKYSYLRTKQVKLPSNYILRVSFKFYNARFLDLHTKKFYLKKKKRSINKKMQAILKNHLLNLHLLKYLKQYFGLNVRLHIKNVKMFLKNSARKLNKVLFKQLRFYKKFKFLKDTIYVLNISTYCKSAYFFSEHLVNQLCKLRKQWPIISVTSQIITKILKVRLNIKGCKILISGRLQGRDRKKTYFKVFGLLPLQTFSTNISYSLSQDYNVFGMFGVRIWLYYL